MGEEEEKEKVEKVQEEVMKKWKHMWKKGGAEEEVIDKRKQK